MSVSDRPEKGKEVGWTSKTHNYHTATAVLLNLHNNNKVGCETHTLISLA